MPAPTPSLIVDNPAPLNPYETYPFRRDVFPADLLLGNSFGSLAPKTAVKDLPADANRKEGI